MGPLMITDTLVDRVTQRIKDCQNDNALVFGYEDRHYPSLLFCCIDGYAGCHCEYADKKVGQCEPICTYRQKRSEQKP